MMLSDIGPGVLAVFSILIYLLPGILIFWFLSYQSKLVKQQKKILTKLEEIESRLPRQEEQQK